MDKELKDMQAAIYAAFMMLTRSERQVLSADLGKILSDLAALPPMDNPLAVARLARIQTDLEGLHMALDTVLKAEGQ